MRRLVAVAVVAVASTLVMASPARAASDPLVADQWHLDKVGAPEAWRTTQGAGSTIAVIDSGVDVSHEDLRDRVRVARSCIGTAGSPSGCTVGAADDNGHGTHVAGIAVATGGNGKGGSGVAPRADLMAIRVLNQVCQTVPTVGERCVAEGSSDDVGAAVRWAADHGADVVNLSWSDDVVVRSQLGSPLADDIAYAWERGAVVVIAAGNDFDAVMGSGYGDLPVIVVTATTRDDERAAYANSVGSGVRWGIAAPGGSGDGECPSGDILSTVWRAIGDGEYGCQAGTSMAAPTVAGAVALLRSAGLSPRQTVDHLLATAEDIGAPGRDAVFGSGLLDLGRAMREVDSARRSAEPAPAPEGPGQAVNGALAGGGQAGAPSGGDPAGPPASTPEREPTAPGPVPGRGPDGPDEPAAAPVVPTHDRSDGGGTNLIPFALVAAAILLADLAAIGRLRRRAA